MYVVIAAALAMCNPPTDDGPELMPLERRIMQVSDLPTVRARDAVFARAGILSAIEEHDDLDRDLIYFHASRESVEQLVVRYGWLSTGNAEALKKEISAEQKKSASRPGRTLAPGEVRGSSCELMTVARIPETGARLATPHKTAAASEAELLERLDALRKASPAAPYEVKQEFADLLEELARIRESELRYSDAEAVIRELVALYPLMTPRALAVDRLVHEAWLERVVRRQGRWREANQIKRQMLQRRNLLKGSDPLLR